MHVRYRDERFFATLFYLLQGVYFCAFIMKISFLSHVDSIRGFLAGFLLLLSFFIFRELTDSVFHVVAAVIVVGVALLLAKKTTHHFHAGHTHAGDSALDVVGPALLFTINIVHPAVDGFSLYETFDQVGSAAGVIMLSGIVVHEVVRQWALIVALAKMNIRRGRAIVITALLGIAFGIALGSLGARFLIEHEWIIDIATLFAYTFIIAEFLGDGHREKGGKRMRWIMVGVMAGVVYAVLF